MRNVAQPAPPPQSWYPAAPSRRSPDATVIGIVVAVVVVLVAIAFFAISLTGASSGFFPVAGAVGVICIPLLFFIVVIVIALASASRRRAIPPPPPIQQPLVPAGQQGPVALSCPNCGGPPTNVDRFGIATCSYCGTRFLVR